MGTRFINNPASHQLRVGDRVYWKTHKCWYTILYRTDDGITVSRAIKNGISTTGCSHNEVSQYISIVEVM